MFRREIRVSNKKKDASSWMDVKKKILFQNSTESSRREVRRRASTTQPPTVGMQNGSSVGTRAYTLHTSLFSHLPRPICMLGRCLSTKISASELARKFLLRCELLVGKKHHDPPPPPPPPPSSPPGAPGTTSTRRR